MIKNLSELDPRTIERGDMFRHKSGVWQCSRPLRKQFIRAESPNGKKSRRFDMSKVMMKIVIEEMRPQLIEAYNDYLIQQCPYSYLMQKYYNYDFCKSSKK